MRRTGRGQGRSLLKLVCLCTLAPRRSTSSFLAHLAAIWGRFAVHSAATLLRVPPERHLTSAIRVQSSQHNKHCSPKPHTKKTHSRRDTVKKKHNMPRVARIRVPIYQETGKHTLYRIEVTTDDGRTRKVERRYRDVLRFHGTLCRAAPHPKLEQFDFPHKSILNTNAEFTKERRRSGFEAYFALLLSLGPNYAPFVETFLKADERTLDDSGHSRPPTPTPVAQAPVVFDDDEDDDESTIAIQQPSLVLERPRSLTHWALCFYLPVSLATYAHCCVLTLLGALHTEDWSKGQAWLAVLSAPLVLCVALALLAPAVDDSDEVM